MRNALVFGGTRGIGKETCNLLASRGWSAIGIGRKTVDMNSRSSVNVWARRFFLNPTSVDAIVFSHGEWFSRPLTQHFPSSYIEQYESRVLNPMTVILQFADYLKVNSGSVTFVSSTRGFIGGVVTGPYSLACAAQLALVQGFAREFSGIRFNAVSPGLTDTKLGAEVIATGGAKPSSPMNTPEFVAGEIVRLIESGDNGKIMRVVDNESVEAKWIW